MFMKDKSLKKSCFACDTGKAQSRLCTNVENEKLTSEPGYRKQGQVEIQKCFFFGFAITITIFIF